VAGVPAVRGISIRHIQQSFVAGVRGVQLLY